MLTKAGAQIPEEIEDPILDPEALASEEDGMDLEVGVGVGATVKSMKTDSVGAGEREPRSVRFKLGVPPILQDASGASTNIVAKDRTAVRNFYGYT